MIINWFNAIWRSNRVVRMIVQCLNKIFKFHKTYRNANGQLHRENGPAIIRKFPYYFEEWWVNGKRHREDGPAVIYDDGSEDWCQDGKLHRLDGPAVIRPNPGHPMKYWYNHYEEQARFGKTFTQYFYKGKYIPCSSLGEFQRKIKLISFL